MEQVLPNNQLTEGTPCGVVGDLKAEWLSLFEQVRRTRQTDYRVAEPGYYLIAVLGQAPSIESAIQARLAHRHELATGRLVRLEMLDEYDLQIRNTYRIWAAPFAPEIDAGHLHAGAYVDFSLFQHRLWDCLTEHYLGYEEPESGIIIIREPFRQWVNLFRAVVEMVMSAQCMSEAIEKLVGASERRLNLYEEFFYRLKALFPGYYFRVEDHAFAVWDGRSPKAVGLNYWALGDTEEEMERRFLESVLMVRKLLAQVSEPVLFN